MFHQIKGNSSAQRLQVTLHLIYVDLLQVKNTTHFKQINVRLFLLTLLLLSRLHLLTRGPYR